MLKRIIIILMLSLVTVMASRRILLSTKQAPIPSAPSFTYYSANFDGADDYLTKAADLVGITDGDKGLLSFWLKVDGTNGDFYNIIYSNPSYVFFRRDGGNNISLLCLNPSATTVLELRSSGNGGDGMFTNGVWRHVIASWDLSSAANSWIYVDGVDRTTRTTHIMGETINYAASLDWGIGARPDDGSGKMNGLLCELYFTTEYLDISQASNRDKFFNSGTSKPVDLGADGSTPTGTQPLLYFHNQVTDWDVNLGSGGSFTEQGTLADGGADKP